MKKLKRISAVILSFVMAFSAIGAVPGNDIFNTGITAYAAEYTAAVSNIKSKASKNSVKLSWDKVSSASTYRVEVKNSSGKYEKATYKLSSSQGRITANVTGLSSGRKYTFKITPMKKSGDDYIRGKSKAYSATTEGTPVIPFPSEFSKDYVFSPLCEDEHIFNFDYVGKSAATESWTKYAKYLANYGFTLNRYKVSSGAAYFEVYYDKKTEYTGVIALYTDGGISFYDDNNINPSFTSGDRAKYKGGSSSRIIAPDKIDSSMKYDDRTTVGSSSVDWYNASNGKTSWKKYLAGLEDYGYKLMIKRADKEGESYYVYYNGQLVGYVSYFDSDTKLSFIGVSVY